jgi:hypothetical protein
MTLTGIWENEYVCRLGILDHTRELNTINDEIIRYKNSRGSPSINESRGIEVLEDHFKNECVDLFLILNNYIELITHMHTSLVNPANERILKRLDTFESKSKEKSLNPAAAKLESIIGKLRDDIIDHNTDDILESLLELRGTLRT